MHDQQPRLLRHRRVDTVFEPNHAGQLVSMPSDSGALEEYETRIRPETPSPFDEGESRALAMLLLIDSPDGEPIAYSPPHRFGRFWIVPRLWLHKEKRT